MSDPDDATLDRILAEQVYCGSGYKPFTEMTADEVAARAEELRAAAGFGPTQRIASVASVWEGLSQAMRDQPAATVGELERERLASRADRLWVVPPGGSFL